MVDVILHIGLGKCGSSALQQALSQNSILKSKSSQYKHIKYVSIDQLGHLHVGKKLKKRSESSISGYSASCHTEKIGRSLHKSSDILKKRLETISNNNKTLIVMSCEAWSQQIEIFIKYAFLEKLNIRAKAICYVRNPVEWINSAWWQWGAWSKNDLDTFVEESLDTHVTKWHSNLQEWKKLLGEDQVTVKVLPKDIVSDFYDFIEADISEYKESRNNVSLPGEVLRFYQKHRELRADPHDSTMDFIIPKYVKFDNTYSKTPWVLTQKHIETIIDRSKQSNNELMSILDGTSELICRNDLKWWDKHSFDNKKVMPELCTKSCLTSNDLDKLLFDTFKSMKKLSLQNMNLQRKLYLLEEESVDKEKNI